MSGESLTMLWYFGIFIALLLVAGVYCILATFNLTRALIGFEILIKAVTLLIILVGHLTGRVALAQAMVITLIVIEVVIMVVAGGVVLQAFRHYNTIDTRKLTELKG